MRQNYDNDPLIIYGLYQGNIGGPNIRRTAYTGKDVYRALKNNATEFINSNRGTYSKDERVFEVSVLYDRNRAYFPDFDADLSGSYRDLGGSFADNRAALLDSMKSAVVSDNEGPGGATLGAAVGTGS